MPCILYLSDFPKLSYIKVAFFWGGLFCYPLWTPPVNWTPPDSFRPVSARDLLDARDDSGNTALIYAAAKARFCRSDAADGPVGISRKKTMGKPWENGDYYGKIHHFPAG